MPNDNQQGDGAKTGDKNKGEVRLKEIELEDFGPETAGETGRGSAERREPMEPIYDVPVSVRAVLGKSTLAVNQLLELEPGAVLELDRKVGEPVDIYVNNRLVARGEVVIVDDHLGVTMTEIVSRETE